jgi:hypothetical protein
MAGKQKQFIVTVDEKKMSEIDKIARSLAKDGNKIGKISKMFGIINMQSEHPLEVLKKKYIQHGITIESEGEKFTR